MRKALLLLTLVLIFCNFRFIAPEPDARLLKGNQHPAWNDNEDDVDHATCECGVYGAGNHFPADVNPPVFNFHNQTFAQTAMVGIAQNVIAAYTTDFYNEQTALGPPDGNGAKIKSDGKLTVKLSTVVPTGSEITIYWRQETGHTETSTLAIKELNSLDDDSTYYSGIFSTDNEVYYPVTVHANVDTRYLELHCLGSSFLRIDAVTYSIPNDSITTSVIPNDTINSYENIRMPLVTDDCDALVEVSYDDSIGNGTSGDTQIIKRKYIAADNCGNLSYAVQNIVVMAQRGSVKPTEEPGNARSTIMDFNEDVVCPNKALGVRDGKGAKLKANGKLTLRLGAILPAGQQYQIYLRQESSQQGEAILQVLETADLSGWTVNSAIPVRLQDNDYYKITLTSKTATQYIKLFNKSNADIRIDAVVYHLQENDSVTNTLAIKEVLKHFIPELNWARAKEKKN